MLVYGQCGFAKEKLAFLNRGPGSAPSRYVAAELEATQIT
eukprot:CAMPEP_0172904098 /NCGR_PEP_ID=MMETSP1075-20121228/171899_1 /TAXON_ID=2916 /ORGANISM="Ceratium fusus, Strain PA161109" /LENGTH=39 /DNA_ID= /DNA_START= /DNA_END= /DNA_ORIENTATION=